MRELKVYDFKDKYAESEIAPVESYENIIAKFLPGTVVKRATVEEDKRGIDYIATYSCGVVIYIDIKTRKKGCSAKWGKNGTSGEEELSLESFSVMPENGREGKIGWTLDETKKTHYTLHVFDPSDSQRVFLLPFQLLRLAFIKNKDAWFKEYHNSPQDSGTWHSECVFVPASVVLQAILDVSYIGKARDLEPIDPNEMLAKFQVRMQKEKSEENVLPIDYKFQNGCHNCQNCYTHYEFQEGPWHYCMFDAPPRPLSGCYEEEFIEPDDPAKPSQYEVWDEWKNGRQVYAWGMCSNWESKPKKRHEPNPHQYVICGLWRFSAGINRNCMALCSPEQRMACVTQQKLDREQREKEEREQK